MKKSIIFLFICILFLGCGQDKKEKADTIIIKSGDQQASIPGTKLKKSLVVEVLSAKRRGFLGGKAKRYGVAGEKVFFEPLENSKNLKLSASECLTDKGGRARIDVTLDNNIGDRYIKAFIKLQSGKVKKVIFRLVSGVVLSGNKQEAYARKKLTNPLTVQVLDRNKKGISGVKVYFKVSGEKRGSKISIHNTETDDEGKAQTEFTLGKKTGQYYVTAEIADTSKKINIRGITFKAIAINEVLLIMGLIGGLAIFIFGMRMMSENLQLVAGERLKGVLQLFTKNRFVAVIAGAVVTGAIQSSSACTVMTVGFVNAGLLTLKQAIGVVMGANIGTTLTAQIISFKLNNLAYPAIALGLLMSMLSKKKVRKFWGQVFIGFGLLFLGMTVMSGVLKPLRNSPSFIAFFHNFDCSPVNGIMPMGNVLWAIFIGTVMTIAIQSSSATIGLALALAGSGLINFYTAVPLILGDNIGTTSTAIIASIGANKASKRTALVHVLFNMIGVIYMFLLFFIPYNGKPIFLYFIDQITAGNVFAVSPENIERHIAMAHSFFNVFNVIIFLPFVGLLAYLAQKLIRTSKDTEDQISYLEPHLLDTPSIAIEQATKEISYMTKLAWKNIQVTFNAFVNNNIDNEEKILKREARIDDLQHEITSYLVKLSQRKLKASEAKLLPMLIHSVNDAERMGDKAINILELAERRYERKIELSAIAVKEITIMYEHMESQYNSLHKAFWQRDFIHARTVMEKEKKLNELEDKYSRNHTKRLEKGECQIAAGILFLEALTNLEKIGDRMNNIAERICEVLKYSDARLKTVTEKNSKAEKKPDKSEKKIDEENTEVKA